MKQTTPWVLVLSSALLALVCVGIAFAAWFLLAIGADPRSVARVFATFVWLAGLSSIPALGASRQRR